MRAKATKSLMLAAKSLKMAGTEGLFVLICLQHEQRFDRGWQKLARRWRHLSIAPLHPHDSCHLHSTSTLHRILQEHVFETSYDLVFRCYGTGFWFTNCDSWLAYQTDYASAEDHLINFSLFWSSLTSSSLHFWHLILKISYNPCIQGILVKDGMFRLGEDGT